MIEIDLDFGWRPEDRPWMDQRIAITAWCHERGVQRRFNGAEDWEKPKNHGRLSTRTYWFPDETILDQFRLAFPDQFNPDGTPFVYTDMKTAGRPCGRSRPYTFAIPIAETDEANRRSQLLSRPERAGIKRVNILMPNETSHIRKNEAELEAGVDRLVFCIKVLAAVVEVIDKIVDADLAQQSSRS